MSAKHEMLQRAAIMKVKFSDAILKSNVLNGYNFKGLCITQQIAEKCLNVNI